MNYSSSLVLVNFNPNHLVHSCNPQLPSRQLTGPGPLHHTSHGIGALCGPPSQQVCVPVLMCVEGEHAPFRKFLAVTWSQPVSMRAKGMREELIRPHTHRTYLEAFLWGQTHNLSSRCPPDLPTTRGQKQSKVKNMRAGRGVVILSRLCDWLITQWTRPPPLSRGRSFPQ